jgi:hypothetical protein
MEKTMRSIAVNTTSVERFMERIFRLYEQEPPDTKATWTIRFEVDTVGSIWFMGFGRKRQN